MRNWMLAAGAAALAIGAPALADRGGQGGGHGGGHGGKEAKADRGGGQGGQGRSEMRRGGNDRGPGHAMRGGGDHGKKGDRVVVRADNRGHGGDKIKVRVDNDDKRVFGRDFDDDNRFARARGLDFGCPPGLDKKDNGCMPPGQVKNLLGAPLRANFAESMLPFAYRNWYRDNDDYLFRAGDGFIYRVNRSNNLVDGLIPLFGNGYYMVGDPWPEPYNFYNVPYQYRSYWPDGGDAYYRYGDGAIYSVDPKTNLVNSIVALVAGDLGVGSPLPVGYDTYNVPFAYRDRYYDSAEAWYRYNDGYIYRVDPTTRLVTAVIDAIV